jgi:hypothetical protein
MPASPASRAAVAGLSPIPSGASPLVAGSAARSTGLYARNPLDELPSTGVGSATSPVPVAAAFPEVMAGSTVSHADAIIPFNLAIGEKLLGAAENQLQGHDRAQPISSLSFSAEQLVSIQHEATEYVDGLGSILKNLFAQDNDKVRKRLGDLADTPLTFQYFRLQQQMMQLSGDYSLQRDKEVLHKLASLLE